MEREGEREGERTLSERGRGREREPCGEGEGEGGRENLVEEGVEDERQRRSRELPTRVEY